MNILSTLNDLNDWFWDLESYLLYSSRLVKCLITKSLESLAKLKHNKC